MNQEVPNQKRPVDADITKSIHAEQSVLGSILMDNDNYHKIMDILQPMDFSTEIHQKIYESMVELINQKRAVDLVTTFDKLKTKIKEDINEIDGYNYIADLTTAVDFTKNVVDYAKIVKEKSTLRSLISVSSDIISKCRSGEEIETILEYSEKSVFDISQKNIRQGVYTIEEVLKSTFDIIEENIKNNKDLKGLDTGFIDLNKMTGGLQKTDLVLIAARPAMGKTAFALNLALNAAMKEQAKVMLFSLEMSKEQLMFRLISATSKIDMKSFSTGKQEPEDMRKMLEAANVLQTLDLFIDDSAGITPLEIRSKCRKQKMQTGLDLVVIDYLQLMEVSGSAESRQQEIAKISRSLKILAKEMNCPVIALSQLSRAPELRKDNRPILSDLRESGAIEQDADIVMFLYRDEYYHEDSEDKNIAELIIAKHRNGETGTVRLTWQGQYQLFLNNAQL